MLVRLIVSILIILVMFVTSWGIQSESEINNFKKKVKLTIHCYIDNYHHNVISYIIYVHENRLHFLVLLCSLWYSSTHDFHLIKVYVLS